jgi:hypothetical protein
MATHLIDSGGKLFVGTKSAQRFHESMSRKAEDPQEDAPTAKVNDASIGVDPSLMFLAKRPAPLLTQEIADAILKRIADMDGDAIRKLLAQQEGQRWLLPLDPKTELSYRFFALASILDLMPEPEPQKEEAKK